MNEAAFDYRPTVGVDTVDDLVQLEIVSQVGWGRNTCAVLLDAEKARELFLRLAVAMDAAGHDTATGLALAAQSVARARACNEWADATP